MSGTRSIFFSILHARRRAWHAEPAHIQHTLIGLLFTLRLEAVTLLRLAHPAPGVGRASAAAVVDSVVDSVGEPILRGALGPIATAIPRISGTLAR